MTGQFIHLMKLGMGRHPQVDVAVGLDILVRAVNFYYQRDDAIAYVVGNGARAGDPVDQSNAIYIAKLEDNIRSLSMLLVRGDPGRGVPAFVNPRTRRIKTIQSDEPGAVRAASTHIVISKQGIAAGADQGRFRMAMEQSSGISRVLARDLLGTLLQRYAEEHPGDFEATKKRKKRGERPEIIPYRPTVRFHPHENANLRDDLLNGRIGGFKLVRGRTEFQGEADDPQIERLDVQLTARIVPTQDFGRVRALADHLQQSLERISFEDLKLELIDEDGAPLPSPGVISLDAGADGDGDMRYCKKVKIDGLRDIPPECHTDFHQAILRFTKSALNDETHWV